MNLRKLAKGRDCQVRVPGVCNGNRETVVLAHYRMAGMSGMGIKSPDWCACYACSACHDAIDGRARSIHERERLRLYHAEGVLRTLLILQGEEVTPW